MNLSRRGILTGLIAAPLVARADNLMRMRGIVMPAVSLPYRSWEYDCELDLWTERIYYPHLNVQPEWLPCLLGDRRIILDNAGRVFECA